jgi:hypothetical protein
MGIGEYISDKIFKPRLEKRGVLVIYDPDRRYREVCDRLVNDEVNLIDTSESSLEGRLAALGCLRELGKPQTAINKLLVYVPAHAPVDDAQKQVDPFSLYTECGAVFPADDGDEFMNLCLRYKADHATQIRRIFSENPNPSFSIIDAVGGGASWPQLRALLKAESAAEILVSLLVPNVDQQKALKESGAWSQEARDFLNSTLSMNVVTRSKTLTPLAEELWRYLLFSEFVFDLPDALPPDLGNVPRAPEEARRFVFDCCDRLRSDLRTQTAYIEQAERVQKDLDLAARCRQIEDLGERDTFSFEERSFLYRAINGLLHDRPDHVREMLRRHEISVWDARGDIKTQWDLINSAAQLLQTCDDMERELQSHSRSQEQLIDFYTDRLMKADTLQRNFEQAIASFAKIPELLSGVIDHTRARYGKLAAETQVRFTSFLSEAGWPPKGRLANAEVFDRFVGARLKDRGRKVAYLMVDALRYELGVVLAHTIVDDLAVEIHPAFAQLPTITPVGMASLLPGAQAELYLDNVGGSLAPKLGDTTVNNVAQRMDLLRKRFGDRFYEMTLADFTSKPSKKLKLPPTVELLVLRSTEIDSHLENNPETTLSLIPQILKQIRAALNNLGELGFQDAIIAADHGFFLNAHAEAGDVCAKPQGNWPVVAHDRLMLGDGVADSHSFVLPAEKLGIRGAFKQCAGPRSMAPYKAGHLYFHGGISLAEAVVSVLVVKLASTPRKSEGKFTVKLSYRNGAKRITTRLPVVDVELRDGGLFVSEVEIRLEAHDEKGNVVGEPAPGGDVNPATGTMVLKPNNRIHLALRMDSEFEGKFTVKALDPRTLVAYASLSLETDYTI